MSLPGYNPRPGSASAAQEVLASDIPWDEAARFAHDAAKSYLGYRRSHWAEDVAQESLSRLFRHAARTRAWKPFLQTVVANTARSHLRREGRRRKMDGANISAAEGAESSDPGPCEKLMTAGEQAQVNSLLEQLDTQFGRGTRFIVVLRNAGVPWAEIARTVDLPIRTCSSRQEKAYKWMKRCLCLQAKEDQRD